MSLFGLGARATQKDRNSPDNPCHEHHQHHCPRPCNQHFPPRTRRENRSYIGENEARGTQQCQTPGQCSTQWSSANFPVTGRLCRRSSNQRKRKISTPPRGSARRLRSLFMIPPQPRSRSSRTLRKLCRGLLTIRSRAGNAICLRRLMAPGEDHLVHHPSHPRISDKAQQ